METVKTKVLNREIVLFMQLAEAYLRKSNNKFCNALKRQKKLVQKQNEEIQDTLQEISINLASVDDKGNLIVSNDQYVYKPKERLEMTKKQRAILDKEVEIENYWASDDQIPSDLEYDFRKAFENFVIKVKPEEEKTEE